MHFFELKFSTSLSLEWSVKTRRSITRKDKNKVNVFLLLFLYFQCEFTIQITISKKWIIFLWKKKDSCLETSNRTQRSRSILKSFLLKINGKSFEIKVKCFLCVLWERKTFMFSWGKNWKIFYKNIKTKSHDEMLRAPSRRRRPCHFRKVACCFKTITKFSRFLSGISCIVSVPLVYKLCDLLGDL